MLAWLVPIAVFWSLAALYLGGAAINIEGGGGGRQTSGLLLLFASYLGVYTICGLALTGVAGAAFGGIVFPVLIASISIPLLTRVMFKLVGVSVSRAD
ncbi:MAG TPA: hypothetical protein DHW20_06250 [Gemmatimonadetes bacterium]|nr:hypothetical protein [Gemmatimonadota bacterium]